MTKFINTMRWLALCLMFLAPSYSFGFGLRLLTVSRRTSYSRLHMALKDGAQEKIATIRSELAVMESLSSAEQDEETMHSFRTILSCANALQEIDRDMETFQEHLTGTDARLKTIAEGFSKEFLACKEQIETQLNSLL